MSDKPRIDLTTQTKDHDSRALRQLILDSAWTKSKSIVGLMSKIQVNTITSLLLSASIFYCGSSANAAPHILTYNGTVYSVDYFYGSRQNNTQFFNINYMPWFNNSNIALAFATADPSTDRPNTNATFNSLPSGILYATAADLFDTNRVASRYGIAGITPTSGVSRTNRSLTTDYYYAYILPGIISGNDANASNPYSTTFAGGTLIADQSSTFSENYNTGTGGSINGNGKLATFSGVFSGIGSISFANNVTGGNTTLSAANTYTGATTVGNGSTLMVNGSISSSSGLTINSGGTVGGAGTLPSTTIQSGGTIAPGNTIGTVNIAGNLTLEAGSTSALDISTNTADKIAATGVIALGGNLVLTFTGANHDTANPYILFTGSSFTGAFSSVSATGALSGYSYSLQYNSSNILLLLSTVLDTGNTTNISNPSSTTFTGGTLSIDTSGNFSNNWTLSTPIGASSNTIDQNGKISTLSGVLSGSGGLTFSNTAVGGRIIISGTNTYTGATTIADGAKLSVNGSIASSSGLTVNAGGTIEGSGTLPTTIIPNGAVIAPGNSIGTLTIAGNYSLNGGVEQIEIQGPQNDQITVTGHVTPFTGTTSLISFGGGTAWPTFTYTIVTGNASAPFATSNSLSLDQTQITPSALLQLGTNLIQEADGNPRTFDVQWRPINGTGATASAMQSLGAFAGNGLAAAGLFDSAFSRLATAAAGNGNAGGAAIGTTGFSTNQAAAAGLSTDFINRLAALVAIPTGAQLQVAVGSITPESYAAFQSVGLNSLRLQRERLTSQAGNCKDTGWIINSSSTGKTGSTTGSRTSKIKRPLCAFATGGNATSTINGRNGLSGYDSAIAGGYYGLELEASKNWILGAAYGYGTAALSNFGASANSVSSTINSVSLYSVYKPKTPWSVKGILGYGNYNLSGRRNLIAIGNGNPLTANTNANGYTAAVLADYSLPLTKPAATLPVFLKPMLGLAYGAYQQNGFSESGDATMNLNVSSHTSQSLIGTIGAELVAAIPINKAKTQVLKPRLAVAYQVDGLADSSGNNSIDAALPAAGGSLTTNGQNRGVNDLTIAGTLEYVIAAKASLYATASYEAFSTGSQFAYGGGVKINF